jgi:hypothetical protein
LASGVFAPRHLATGVTQAGNGRAHRMRQPAEPLPDLRNRGALGPFEQLISTARFVLARGRSASGILAIAKLTPPAIRSDCEAGLSGGGVVFFDRPMLLEAPLEAAAASAAASPVWVVMDFDRACRVRRRGVRWRSRAGWFASPISDFSALFACLRGCLLAIVFILWIRIALRDACTTTSPALGARRAATKEGAVDMDSNASRAREVERKVWWDNDFLLPAGF